MKKTFIIFMAMFFHLFTMSPTAEAVDLNKVVDTTKAIGQEFIQYEKDPRFRDFDFFIKMSLIQLKTWNDNLDPNNSNEQNIKISQANVVMLNIQYLNMQQYLKNYVIAKSNNPNVMRQKCSKMMKLINEGLIALK